MWNNSQETSEESGPEAPEETRPEPPEKSGPDAQEDSGQEAPDEFGPEAPEESGPEAQEDCGQEAPDESRPEASEETQPEAPEESGPDEVLDVLGAFQWPDWDLDQTSGGSEGGDVAGTAGTFRNWLIFLRHRRWIRIMIRSAAGQRVSEGPADRLESERGLPNS